jgi:hypothetical protein
MKKVKMKSSIATPKFRCREGSQVILPDAMADSLIAGNQAVLVEAAVVAPVEKAARTGKPEPRKATGNKKAVKKRTTKKDKK